jgi:hypothetical protein
MQKASDTYKPIQNLEFKQLLFELTKSPVRFRERVERYATSITVVVTYGRRVHDIYADEVISLNRNSQDFLTSVK